MEDKKTRVCLMLKSQARKPVAMLRKRWMEGVTDGLEKRGFEMEQVNVEQIYEANQDGDRL